MHHGRTKCYDERKASEGYTKPLYTYICKLFCKSKTTSTLRSLKMKQKESDAPGRWIGSLKASGPHKMPVRAIILNLSSITGLLSYHLFPNTLAAPITLKRKWQVSSQLLSDVFRPRTLSKCHSPREADEDGNKARSLMRLPSVASGCGSIPQHFNSRPGWVTDTPGGHILSTHQHSFIFRKGPASLLSF